MAIQMTKESITRIREYLIWTEAINLKGGREKSRLHTYA